MFHFLVTTSSCFSSRFRTWVYKEKGYTYSINLFQPLKGCSGATVCKSPATNLGKTYTSSLSADSSGFSLNFTDGDCDSKAHSKLMTILQFRCGKYMVGVRDLNCFFDLESR